jgi:hypothetical protein
MPKAHSLIQRVTYTKQELPNVGICFTANVQPGHYKLLSLLRFYVYQVDEGDTHFDYLTKALRSFINTLCAFIVESSPEYAALPWGHL